MRIATLRSLGIPCLAAFLAFFSLGCGPDFDPPSELHSLRILGVQKDFPYAQPGQKGIKLKMLWTDASPKRPRPVQVVWSGPCFDPAGDLYYACFGQPGVFVDDKGNPTFTLNSDSMSFDMPTDIISSRPAPTDSRNAAYGIAYVFYAVCAGTLTPIPTGEETAFPIGCKDEKGTLLGADDFVAGYSAVYSFRSFSNNNPVISGFSFKGRPFTPESEAASGDPEAICLDDTCTSGSSDPADFAFSCSDRPERCVPTCADDGDSSCPGYNLHPLIDKADPKNQDQDDVSVQLLGRQVGEQMWINYYTEAGGFKSPVRLLNDATTGWNDGFSTEFYAPKTPGPFRVWALAHDNRGGVAWSGITLQAE